MVRRRLSPEERAAWLQLARSVRPLEGMAQVDEALANGDEKRSDSVTKIEKSLTRIALAKPGAVVRPSPAEVLDGSWEKRIQRGLLQPEMSIDLHGHSLTLAYQRLDRALAEAEALGVRVLLVITGKARERAIQGDRPGRGAIRAEIGHWIESSPFSDRIASVRNAHPRHGGAGALYIILRRKK